MEKLLLEFFQKINDKRPEHLQFSDYRLGEMVRDICNLFDLSKQK